MVDILGFTWALIAVGVVALPLYYIFLAVRKRDVYGVLRGMASLFVLGLAAWTIAWLGAAYVEQNYVIGQVVNYLYRGLYIFLPILSAPIFCYGCMRLYTDIKSGMLSRLEITERAVLLACWAGLLYSAWVVFRGKPYSALVVFMGGPSGITLFAVPILLVHYSIRLYRRSIARRTH